MPDFEMLTRLEHETRDHHAAAAADRFSIVGEPTPESYYRFLANVYQFEYAVESQIVYVTELSLRFIAASLRTGLLGEDLLALRQHGHVTWGVLAREVERERFGSVLEALGWMYVVQHNTRHHGSLYRALLPRLRPTLQVASRYLTAHVNDTDSRWHALGAHLDAASSSPERADAIVEAAHRAFERQHAWFVEAQAAPTVEVASSNCV